MPMESVAARARRVASGIESGPPWGLDMSKPHLEFDEIGYWSEMKLDIVKMYAKAYSTILARQPGLSHYYIDGFAGAGFHLSRTTGTLVAGSPLNALSIDPPFKHHFLIDLDGSRIEQLRQVVGDRTDVTLREGDCNAVLLRDVFPNIRYEQYRRALCLLDPYGLQLDWAVISAAGQLRTIDLLLNFPIMDINRNALWSDAERVPPSHVARMTAFWGDTSWQQIAYRKSAQENLFGEPSVQKVSNEEVVGAFRERLQEVAGFQYVSKPIPMRNSTGAVVYYLIFASQYAVARNIADHIFATYGQRGVA